MADLSSPTNVERMLNALDRGLWKHQATRTIPGPVVAWGVWTDVPDGDPTMEAPTGYITTRNGTEVVLDLDDPGGDGIAPVVATIDTPAHDLVRYMVLAQQSVMHGAGLSMPRVAEDASDWDAALSGMTNRRHLLVTPHLTRDVTWEGVSRGEPTEIEPSHLADLLLLGIGSTPGDLLDSQPLVEGLLTLRFTRASAMLGRNVKIRQVVEAFAVGAEGATSIGEALAREAAGRSWQTMYDEFAELEPSIAARFNVGGFSRFLPAAEARLHEASKVATVTFLENVVRAAREAST